MNRECAEQIARAVLYEGYILYPYRPSVKNKQRWTFGGVHPQAYSEATRGAEPCSMQTQCLIEGSASSMLEVELRFLHLTARTAGQLEQPIEQWPQDAEPPWRAVEMLRIGQRQYHTWQEAEERVVPVEALTLGNLLEMPRQEPFFFPPGRRVEPLRDDDGRVGAVLIREQHAIEGTIEISASQLASGLFAATIKIVNRTPVATDDAPRMTRDEALMRSLVSTHTLLGVKDAAFVSLMDPPEMLKAHASACNNIGAWPMLVGRPPQRDTMLSSPIVLYDYPQVAAESPGDLFDGTEIDEILTLRILTLSDEEKEAMAALEPRARSLLERTESLARRQMMGLHGTMRDPNDMHRWEGLP